MNEDPVVRLGFLGCGEHAMRSHLVPIVNDPRYTVVAAFDPNRMIFSEGEWPNAILRGMFVCHDESELLTKTDTNAVVIASPDTQHARSLLAAVEAGKHVLVEKPVGTTHEDLLIVSRALKLATEKKLVVTSCHPRRFDPPFLTLSTEIPRHVRLYGRVVSFDFDFSYHHPSGDKHDGSLLLDHANHEIDLLHFLFGYAEWTQGYRLIDSTTAYSVAGIRSDGIEFTFRGTRSLVTAVYREYARVRFERASIDIDTYSGSMRVVLHENGRTFTLRGNGTNYPVRFKGVMGNFADAIAGTARPYLTSTDLMFNTKFCLRLKENAEVRFGCPERYAY